MQDFSRIGKVLKSLIDVPVKPLAAIVHFGTLFWTLRRLSRLVAAYMGFP